MNSIKYILFFLLNFSWLSFAEIVADPASAQPEIKAEEESETIAVQQPSCQELISNPQLVQAQWDSLRASIEANGFSIEQLEKALKAVVQLLDMVDSEQNKARTFFIRKVQRPLMLISSTAKDAQVMRQSMRDSLVKIDNRIDTFLSSGENPFNVDELANALSLVEARQQQLNSLINTNLSYVMKERRELNIDPVQSDLKNTIFLVKNTGDESVSTRKMRFYELQRALSISDNLIETKCRIWEVLR